MRVLVTGGTGFAGAYTVKALVDAGHDVKLLVRKPELIDAHLRPIGVGAVDHVVGDMTDRDSVRTALQGCDAVVHLAAIVALSRTQADRVLHGNPLGAENVLGQAAELGLNPIVHVSSVSAVFDPELTVLDRTSPLVVPHGAYGQSKVLCDRIAQQLQADGAPVVITYPGAIMGPMAGPLNGEANPTFPLFLKLGNIPMRDGGLSTIDVRDLGALHAACIDQVREPRRYLAGGPFLTWPAAAGILTELTGRKVRVLPVSGAAFRTVGRALDLASRVLPFESQISEESTTFSTRWVPTDDSPAADELGVHWRPAAETIRDIILSQAAVGLVKPKLLGRLAEA